MNAPRLLRIASPLGDGALIVTRLSTTERLGLPYRVDVDALGSDPNLLPTDLLTKEVTVSVAQTLDGQVVQRFFHGVVGEFHRLGPGAARRMTYRLVIVPGLWRLGFKRNCRIFQDKTVQDIVNLLLRQHSQPTPSWGILPPLEPIPYCTQFNETDLEFISRLLEEHGMTYYFTHSASAHTLCISATAQGFPVFEGDEVQATHATTQLFGLNAWRRMNRARSASTKYEDMDSERSQPSVVLKKSSDTRTYAGEPSMWTAGEDFRWPGGMSTRPGLDSAAVAMGAQETTSEEFRAAGRDPRMRSGTRMFVSVQAEDGTAQKQQYVVTAVQHEAEDYSGLVTGAGDVETYHNSLSLVAASRTWMPAPIHPRPVMSGLYSATVTGPSGEQIHVDEYGRIKVKFRWDRLAADDDTSSCWVRVTQAAAGAWGGTWFLPRVDDEVLMAFLDGDPDRPVVIGSLYGKDAKPPFLPGANRSQSGVRTRSYKSDDAQDANILRFEDKKDAEEVLLHAQKDLTVEVENDETRSIGRDQTETIQNARTVTIKDADDTLTLQTGNKSVTLQMGDINVKCDMGSITMEALQTITLKVGQNTVVINQMGITVKGLTITEDAQLVHRTKAAMLEENADAMVQVQGGIVMLN